MVRVLGSGGMGEVFEVFDREHQQRVALKRLRHHTAELISLLKSEFRALRALRHPNLVSLGELIAHDDLWCFTMELVEGVDFISWVHGIDAAPDAVRLPARNTDFGDAALEPTRPAELAEGTGTRMRCGVLDQHRLRGGLEQLALALMALHERGRLHLDVKPSNALVTPKGRVVLLDLGFSATCKRFRTICGGTVSYMPPEQASLRPLTPAADWYAFGTLLYLALAERLPFRGQPFHVLEAKRSHPPETAPLRDAPPDLAGLALSLLSIDPADRPGGDDVLAVLRGPRRSRRSSTLPPPSPPFVGRTSELELVIAEAAVARSGGTRVIVIEGEMGAGKTALAEHACQRLRFHDESALVLWAGSDPREDVTWRGLDDLVDAIVAEIGARPKRRQLELVPADAALLVPLFPAFGCLPVVTERPAQPIADPVRLHARVAEILAELVVNLAGRRLPVLVLDNAGAWTEDATMMLGQLLRAPAMHRALVLALCRSQRGEAQRIMRTLAAAGVPRLRFELGGIDNRDAEALAEWMLDERTEPWRHGGPAIGDREPQTDRAAAIAHAAHGNPCALGALVERAEIWDVVDDSEVTLDERVIERAERLAPAARLIFDCMVVASSELSPTVVARVTRLADFEIGPAIDELVRVGLVCRKGALPSSPVALAVDPIQAAVAIRLDAAARRAWHARLAAALDEVHGDAVARSRHWRAAGEIDGGPQ